VRESGWLADITGARRILLGNALAGLYVTAGTELVRQPIERWLNLPYSAYRFHERWLVVSPDGLGRVEWAYPLAEPEELLVPQTAADDTASPAPSLPRRAISFAAEQIIWKDWCRDWDPGQTDVEPLVDGLLPEQAWDEA